MCRRLGAASAGTYRGPRSADDIVVDATLERAAGWRAEEERRVGLVFAKEQIASIVVAPAPRLLAGTARKHVAGRGRVEHWAFAAGFP